MLEILCYISFAFYAILATFSVVTVKSVLSPGPLCSFFLSGCIGLNLYNGCWFHKNYIEIKLVKRYMQQKCQCDLCWVILPRPSNIYLSFAFIEYNWGKYRLLRFFLLHGYKQQDWLYIECLVIILPYLYFSCW